MALTQGTGGSATNGTVGAVKKASGTLTKNPQPKTGSGSIPVAGGVSNTNAILAGANKAYQQSQTAPKASYSGGNTGGTQPTAYQQQAAPVQQGPSEADLQKQREAEARAQYDQIEAQRQAELQQKLASIPTLEAWLGQDQQYVGDVDAANRGWANNTTNWRNNLSQQTSAADFKTALDQLGWRGANVQDYTLGDKGDLSGGNVSGGAWDQNYTYGAYGSGYQSLMNDAAARGMLNSTGYAENLGNFNTDMNNQYNSLLDARRNTATGIGNTASAGYGDYMAGLARYLADSSERGAAQYGVDALNKNGAGAYTQADLTSPFQYNTQAYQGPIYW